MILAFCLLSINSCNTNTQANSLPLSKMAGNWLCHCIETHESLKDSINIYDMCIHKMSENDSFAFYDYFNGGGGYGSDSILFEKYRKEYYLFTILRDSCANFTIPNNPNIRFENVHCQGSDLRQKIHEVKIVDSLGFMCSSNKDTIEKIETFLVYYNGCLDEKSISIKFPTINYRYIPKDIPLTKVSDASVAIVVDTNICLPFLASQPYRNKDLKKQEKCYPSYPIWIINKSNSAIICGKGSSGLFYLYLEEKQKNKWITLSEQENSPCTPVSSLILKSQHTILSKCPILHKKNLKRLRLSYNGQNVYSNVFY